MNSDAAYSPGKTPCTGAPRGSAAWAELGEMRRSPAEVRRGAAEWPAAWRATVLGCTGDRRRGRRRPRRVGEGTPGAETRKKRYGEQEGSEAELVEEFISCWSVWGGPTSSWRFCGSAARRRRLRRQRWRAGGVWTRSWRRGGGLGGNGGPSPPLYTWMAGVGAKR